MTHCARCNGTDGLIGGDGPVIVCRDCVELLGNLVDKPWEASNKLLSTVLELHADAVRLSHDVAQPHGLVWEWIAKRADTYTLRSDRP